MEISYYTFALLLLITFLLFFYFRKKVIKNYIHEKELKKDVIIKKRNFSILTLSYKYKAVYSNNDESVKFRTSTKFPKMIELKRPHNIFSKKSTPIPGLNNNYNDNIITGI